MLYFLDYAWANRQFYQNDLLFTYFNKLAALSKEIPHYSEQWVSSDDVLLLGAFGHPWTRSKYTDGIVQEVWSEIIERFNHIYVYIEDMHGHTFRWEEFEKFLSKPHVGAILTYDNVDQAKRVKQITKWNWVPHHIDLSIFYNARIERSTEYFSYGSLGPHYPKRTQIIRSLQSAGAAVEILEHPGYAAMRHDVVQEKLAAKLNQVKNLVVAPPICGYAVAKYFEGAACGCSLYGELCPDLEVF